MWGLDKQFGQTATNHSQTGVNTTVPTSVSCLPSGLGVILYWCWFNTKKEFGSSVTTRSTYIGQLVPITTSWHYNKLLIQVLNRYWGKVPLPQRMRGGWQKVVQSTADGNYVTSYRSSNSFHDINQIKIHEKLKKASNWNDMNALKAAR